MMSVTCWTKARHADPERLFRLVAPGGLDGHADAARHGPIALSQRLIVDLEGPPRDVDRRREALSGQNAPQISSGVVTLAEEPEQGPSLDPFRVDTERVQDLALEERADTLGVEGEEDHGEVPHHHSEALDPKHRSVGLLGQLLLYGDGMSVEVSLAPYSADAAAGTPSSHSIGGESPQRRSRS